MCPCLRMLSKSNPQHGQGWWVMTERQRSVKACFGDAFWGFLQLSRAFLPTLSLADPMGKACRVDCHGRLGCWGCHGGPGLQTTQGL